MGVASGWVGSSAVSVTGERTMKMAGARLKLGTPFWMSQMVGKNVRDFSITVGHSNFVILVQIPNAHVIPVTNNYGGYSNNSTTTGAGSALYKPVQTQNPAGSVNGSLLGCEITHLSQVHNTGIIRLGLTNGPEQSFTLSFDGTNITFFPYGFLSNTRHYEAKVSTNWLFNQSGKTISVSKV